MTKIWIEAENFRELGGWLVDQQSMETLHSSYVMAHGMGKPVADAVTRVEVPESGIYYVWALTRDWTAVWDVKIPAGQFRIALDGQPLETVLGTNGKEWSWQLAGTCELEAGSHEMRLQDLTGFNGRCDAVCLTTSPEAPSDDREEIERMRREWNWQEIREEARVYDLIVVGGGIAGICTAIAAMRAGVDVLMIHDRGILGGCNSSEIRVCMGGKCGIPPYPNLGRVVKDIQPMLGDPNMFLEEYYEDNRKLFAFRLKEDDNKGIHHIAFNECVTEAVTENGSIRSVVATHTLTGQKTRYHANLFADCSGDAVLSRLAGCEVMYGREASETFNESLAPKHAQKLVMGHSIRWYSLEDKEVSSFPDIDWNLKITDQNCMRVFNGDWEQETGFTRDMVTEIEYIRDYGLRAIYSNWAFQKNHYVDKDAFARHSLKWVSGLGGKRESYRVKGACILTQNDIEEHRLYEDGTAAMTWSIDMHFPEPDNEAEYGEAFRSCAYHRGIVEAYPIPYRCLCARDVRNLFLGGRIVSTSHVAFSAIRVMRTLGQLGEVAGMAAGICKKHDCMPIDVYESWLDELKVCMIRGVESPSAFQCEVGDEEAYHYKDLGWLYLNPLEYEEGADLEKFKRGIRKFELKHKYPMPDILK